MEKEIEKRIILLDYRTILQRDLAEYEKMIKEYNRIVTIIVRMPNFKESCEKNLWLIPDMDVYKDRNEKIEYKLLAEPSYVTYCYQLNENMSREETVLKIDSDVDEYIISHMKIKEQINKITNQIDNE